MPDVAGPAPSHSRRLAREVAFQAIYMSMVGGVEIERALEVALSRHTLAEDAESFVHDLVTGVRANVQELDDAFSPCLATGWSIDRLVISDLVTLRLATFELLRLPDMPPKVTISQAVDLAKRFGTKDSASFINGVLGSLLKETDKAEWESPIVVDPAPPEPEFLELTDQDEDDDQAEPVEEGVKAGSWVIKRDSEEPTASE